MRLLFLWLVVVTFLLFTGIGQKLDSIKYKFGYLYYHEYGTGEPIIVLAGGQGGSYLQAEEIAIETSSKYRVILPEQRGTGRSISAPFDSTTINLQSGREDLNLLLQRLDVQRATFLGHSWGAMLARDELCRSLSCKSEGTPSGESRTL
jgi:proline iminopeptidase